MLYCINITDDAIYGGGGKKKRILVIQGAYYLSCMNLDQFPPKYLDTSMK